METINIIIIVNLHYNKNVNRAFSSDSQFTTERENFKLCDNVPSGGPPDTAPPFSRRTTTMLTDIETRGGYTVPPFTEEELHPGGYYYKIAAHQSRLENFSVYTFNTAPDTHFLYSSHLDCLLELPRELSELRNEGPMPLEFMVPGGFLYWLLGTHTVLKHMNFYTLGLLPGRILVYDAGLDMITETQSNSDLVMSLFPSTCSPQDSEIDYWHMNQDDVHCQNSAGSSALESSELFPTGCEEKQRDIHFGSNDGGLSHHQSVCCGGESRGSGICVYEPGSLGDLRVFHSTLEPRCHLPPCVYLGVNSDPR